MNRLIFRLTVALLTLAVGVGLTNLVRFNASRPNVHQGARQTDTVPLPKPTAPSTPDEKVVDFESGFIEGDKLSHEGYEVQRLVSKDGYDSSVTIKKNGRLIDSLDSGGMGKDSTRFGLFSLLGRDTKQLVIMQYSGGAHCCWTYKVYDFRPNLHVVFDDGTYGDSLGYELHAEDIDADGRYELSQAVMTFDYFHMSHASSVFPTAVFAYDEKSRNYLPANKKYTHYLLSNLTEEIESLVSARATMDESAHNGTYLSAVFTVLLNRIYVGQEPEGWEFFDREYQLSDKKELKKDIKKALRGDPIYRSIYKP